MRLPKGTVNPTRLITLWIVLPIGAAVAGSNEQVLGVAQGFWAAPAGDCVPDEFIVVLNAYVRGTVSVGVDPRFWMRRLTVGTY